MVDDDEQEDDDSQHVRKVGELSVADHGCGGTAAEQWGSQNFNETTSK